MATYNQLQTVIQVLTRLTRTVGGVGVAVGLAGLLVTGCRTAAPKPDDMSAEAHRQEAARAAEAAKRERAEYDARAVTAPKVVGFNVAAGEVAPETGWTYNPTSGHLRTAAQLETHGRQHAAAAAELEKFENAACTGIGRSTRGACPFLSVMAFKVLPNGVRLHLKDASAEPGMTALMRCHLAYARARGFESAPDCPLYIRGVDIEAAADGKGIEVTSRDHAVSLEIIRRSQELFR